MRRPRKEELHTPTDWRWHDRAAIAEEKRMQLEVAGGAERIELVRAINDAVFARRRTEKVKR